MLNIQQQTIVELKSMLSIKEKTNEIDLFSD